MGFLPATSFTLILRSLAFRYRLELPAPQSQFGAVRLARSVLQLACAATVFVHVHLFTYTEYYAK